MGGGTTRVGLRGASTGAFGQGSSADCG